MKMKIVCLLILMAYSIVALADDKNSVSARDLFYARIVPGKTQGKKGGGRTHLNSKNGNGASSGTVDVPIAYKAPHNAADYAKYAHNTGLRYQVIQRFSDGSEAPVDLDTAFHSGDHIRLSFESNMKGYLYVVQQGSTGNWSVLFPDSRINGGQNTIDGGKRYVVPATGWFTFDSNPGTERLMVFLSQQPLDTLPGTTRSADPGGVTVNQSIVDELNNKISTANVRSRALVFEKDNTPVQQGGPPVPAAYVVNKLGDAVVAEIILKHN